MRTGAVYVPDATGENPSYWVKLTPTDVATGEGPDAGDTDEDGTPNWREDFDSARDSGAIVWWPGGSAFQGRLFVVDGIAESFPAQWRPAFEADGDADGIPDGVDWYPASASNNSYWWPGGSIHFEEWNFFLPAKWFVGTNADLDLNDVPDCMEPTLAAIAGSSLEAFYWEGGTFLISGEYSTFDPYYLYECDTGDDDEDLIPNAIDQHPNDPWNGTYYFWPGGSFWIHGVLQPFESGWHPGLDPGDADGDLIPDDLDPLAADPTNNTAYWQGGTWTIDGAPRLMAGRHYAANTADDDADGIPDSFDPYPANSSNDGRSVVWPGGPFVIDGAWVLLPAVTIAITEGDADSDGIPDSVDDYPGDLSNNSFQWVGGPFTVNNSPVVFPNGWHPGSWSDTDSDGIPDLLDDHPTDTSNGNTTNTTIPTFYWDGGRFAVDGAFRFWAAGMYDGEYADTDGDWIPDPIDPYIDDPANNSPATFWWPGGSFMIESQMRILPGQECFGPLDDLGGFPDSDRDGIPNTADQFPSSPLNGTPGIVWPPVNWDGSPGSVESIMHPDNRTVTFTTEAYFFATGADTDADGIPNVADPFPNDPFNARDLDSDSLPDSIEAAFPQFLDPENPEDAETLRYVSGSTDGLTWGQAYALTATGAFGNLLTTLLNPGIDTDADGMGDLYELVNGLNRTNPADAVQASIGQLAEGADVTMNDLILNVEKARYQIPLSYVVTDENEYQTLTGHLPSEGVTHDWAKSVAENDWDGDGVSNVDEVRIFWTDPRSPSYPDDVPSDAALMDAYLLGRTSATTNLNFVPRMGSVDSDGDGIPDMVEMQYALSLDRKLNDSSQTRYIGGLTDGLTWQEAYYQNALGGLQWSLDTDLDGIPNIVEIRYNALGYDLNWVMMDSGNDSPFAVDGTIVTWLQAYQLGLLDTDGDGIPDGIETQYGRNPRDTADASQVRYIGGQTDGLTWLQAYEQGYLTALKPPPPQPPPPATGAVEVAVSSSVSEAGYWSGGGGTGIFTTSHNPFYGTGTGEFTHTDPDTGEVIFTIYDVLTGTELDEYEQMKALPSGSPGMFDGAQWKNSWNDSVLELLDSYGEPVLDDDGIPILHGEWSGTLHQVTEAMEPVQYTKTGATVWNDRLASLPSPAPEGMTQFAGAWQGGGTYKFTDIPGGDEGDGVEITSAGFAAMRGTWLTIDSPGAGTRALYPPNGTALTASTSSDGNHSTRIAFWLKTDNGQSAAHDITRRYMKLTTSGSAGSSSVTGFVYATIPEGQKTSEITSLQPAPGTTESLLPFEFKEVNPESGFDAETKPNWLMVPKDQENWTKAITPANTDLQLQFKIIPGPGGATVAPDHTNQSPETLTVSSPNLGDDSSLVIGVGTTFGTTGLKLSVKKYQMKTVAIHAVTQSYGETDHVPLQPGEGRDFVVCIRKKSSVLWSEAGGDDRINGTEIKTGPNGVCESHCDPRDEEVIPFGHGIPNDIPPQYVPNAPDLQAYLNNVYGLQTNTYFTVTRSDKVVDYDILKNVDGTHDKALNMYGTSDFTDEEKVLRDQVKSSADFNIYYVHDFRFGGAVGKAIGDVAYVKDSTSDMQDVMLITSHEIGHCFGLKHAEFKTTTDTPTGPPNPTYLPNSNPRKRLMYGRTLIESISPRPKLLIKSEWDIINPQP